MITFYIETLGISYTCLCLYFLYAFNIYNGKSKRNKYYNTGLF